VVAVKQLLVAAPIHQMVRRHVRTEQDKVMRIGIEHCAGGRLVEIEFKIVADDLERIDGVVAAVDKNLVLGARRAR
jgi:hypothetical protein